MPDTLQFVDSIAASPTVRLDLNDDTTWGLQYQGTDFSPPRLRRAVAQTLMVDGAVIPAAAYDNRIIRLRLDLNTTTVDSAATQIQKLAIELNRKTNFLKWKPGSTNEVFFRTMRSDVTRITEVPGPGLLRHVDVEVLAEPFAYGLLQTLSNVTVSNNPIAATNPMRWTVTGIKGDVETPLILRIPYSDLAGQGPTVIAVRRRAGAVPFLLQAESMTTGTDTTLQANDAVMVGAGSNYMRCTFATNDTMTARLTSSTFPTSASTDNRGLYRMFVRYRRSVAAGAITLQLVQGFVAFGPRVPTRQIINRTFADLGLVSLPGGADPNDGFAGLTAPAAAGNLFTLFAERAAGGTSNIDFDYFLFVPADERFGIIDWNASSGPTTTVVDGLIDTVYQLGASGEVVTRETAEVSGGLPVVWPGDNTIVFVLNGGAGPDTGTNDTFSSNIDIQQSYHPRYLWVRPVST